MNLPKTHSSDLDCSWQPDGRRADPRFARERMYGPRHRRFREDPKTDENTTNTFRAGRLFSLVQTAIRSEAYVITYPMKLASTMHSIMKVRVAVDLLLMSKFKPGTMPFPRAPLANPAVLRHPVTLPAGVLPAPAQAAEALLPVKVNAVQKVGFVMLALYLLGSYFNDIGFHVFGAVPRLTLVPLALMWVSLALSGNIGRALQAPLGRWWLAMFVVMTLSVPLSTWPGGSTSVLLDFLSKRYVILFCICAVQITAAQCIRFAYLNLAPATLILFLCFRYGAYTATDGRFIIDGSLFFDNSNDLAIGLLLAAASLLFVFFTPNRFLKIVASVEITLCILYILKTGSRGTFLAAIVSAFFAVMFSKRRLLLLLLAPPVLMALLAVVPAQTIERLKSIVVDPEQTLAEGKGGGEVESQLAREETFKLSLKITETHPLLGVGIGMFDDFVQGDAKKAGKHVVSLNTHNAYTQVSSECGIPGFICYLATVILTVKLNYRMYIAFSRKDYKIDGRLRGIAFAGLIGAIGYVVASMFHHIAYSVDLPWLAGETLALWLATKSLLSSTPAVTRHG